MNTYILTQKKFRGVTNINFSTLGEKLASLNSLFPSSIFYNFKGILQQYQCKLGKVLEIIFKGLENRGPMVCPKTQKKTLKNKKTEN